MTAMASQDRTYPSRPHVGVGVAVWREERVLLVKRGRPPRLGQWALPGGALEIGETLLEAARREVLEETGIQIEPLGIVTALDLIEREGEGIKYHYVLVEIAARYVSGEIAVGDDAAEAAWVRLEDIPTLDAWEEVARVAALSRQWLDGL